MNGQFGLVVTGLLTLILSSSSVAAAEVSTTALREQTRRQLRLESIAKDGLAKDAAAAALCDLYVVLRSDPRYATSSMLQGDATKIRRRLLTIARRREIQLGRLGIERPAALAERVDRAIKASLADDSWPADPATATSATATSATADPASATSASATSAAANSGAIDAVAGGGAAAGAGWALVELIQRIVAPDFWQSQGGVGTIHYFAMRRVLVVRATTDVHEQVRDLLMALR